MPINSISLAAHNLYKVNSNGQSSTINNPQQQAVNFQNMVEVQFNKFAKMSPQQILNHVTNASNSAELANSANNGLVEATIREVRAKVHKQEDITKKSLVHEASLVDLITVTTEAKNIVHTMTSVRDKFFESWNNIINMQV